MEIKTASPAQYETAIRKLFPQGDYWDRQFADPQSDISLFCKVKLPELIRFRERMSALLKESNPLTSEELLDNWERVLTGSFSMIADIEQRRKKLLLLSGIKGTKQKNMCDIAETFGFVITGVCFPYRPAFFGFSRFGVDRIAIPAVWQVIYISVNTQGNGNADKIAQFETFMQKILLASNIPYFFYDGGKP